MKKNKLRVIATLLSVLIAISSLSIVSVSAREATTRGHEVQFTYDDLQEFYNKFDSYFYAKRHLDNLGITDPDIINALAPLPDGYVITKTSDPTKKLTDAELKTFLKQLKMYLDAINYLKGLKVSSGSLFNPTTVPAYEDQVIYEVVKFPAGITLEKLPDEEHPKGQKISRSDSYSGIYGYVSMQIYVNAKKHGLSSGSNARYEADALVNEFFTEYTQDFRDAYNSAVKHFGSNADTLSVLFWVDTTTVPPYQPNTTPNRDGNTLG